MIRILYSILLNVDTKTTGTWIHSRIPFSHSSPDVLVNWSSLIRWLCEIKSPLYRVHMQRSVADSKRLGFRRVFYVPLGYMVQMQDQMDHVGKDVKWNDFASGWFSNLKEPMRSLKHTKGAWLCGRLMITRCFRNERFIRLIRKRVLKVKVKFDRLCKEYDTSRDKKACRYEILSRKSTKWKSILFPKVKTEPLVDVQWYLHTDIEGYWFQESGVLNVDFDPWATPLGGRLEVGDGPELQIECLTDKVSDDQVRHSRGKEMYITARIAWFNTD